MFRLPDLLRAATILARRSNVDVALETGIRRSRVERILAARAAPCGDEAARILAACGIDQRLATAPGAFTLAGDVVTLRRRGGGLLPADTILGLLLHRDCRPPPDVDLHDCRLCIDKLSITFNTIDADALLDLISTLGKRIATQASIYKHEYRCGGVFVQHGERTRSGARTYKGRRTSRLEFNPARASRCDWSLVQRLLRLAKPSSDRVSRLDVAVDIPVSLRRVQPLASRKHKVNVFLGSTGVETIYLGVKGSEHQIRIYDGRQRLMDVGRAGVDHPEVTRFEAQLRNVSRAIGDLVALPDPFVHLQLVDLSAHGLALSRRLLANYACVFGLVTLRPHLQPDDFKALVSELEAAAAATVLPHPSDIFAAQWSKVAAKLVTDLGAR